MKNEGKKNFYIIFAAVAFCIICAANFCSSIKSYRYRELCNQYRAEFIRTKEANRALDDRLGRITEVVGRLHETTERNVTDARGIIETTELLRTQIQELENICYGSNTIDSYYNHWDSEFRKEGLMN